MRPSTSITGGVLHATVSPRAARTAALGAREPLRHAQVGPPPSPARRLRRRPEPGPPRAQGAPPHLREADTLPLSKKVLGRAVTAVVCGRARWRLTNPSRPRGGGWRAGRCVAPAAPAAATAITERRVQLHGRVRTPWSPAWPHVSLHGRAVEVSPPARPRRCCWRVELKLTANGRRRL